jgi:PAS domain S-box-containing protein
MAAPGSASHAGKNRTTTPVAGDRAPRIGDRDAASNGAQAPLPARLRALFLISLAVTAVAGGTLLVNLGYLHRTTQQLETLRMAQDALERLQSSLLDAETGQRGYLLTGRPAYLEPYLNAKKAYPATMDSLAGIAVDDVALAQGLAELKPLIEDKMAIVDRTIDRFQSRGDVVQSDAGRQAMDRIRDVIAGLRSHEAAEVESTSALSERRTIITFVLATLAAALAVAALIVVYRAVVREHRRRNIAEESLHDRTALLVAVAEGTDDWIFVKDRVGKLLFVNRALCRAFGLEAVQLLGTLPSAYVTDPAEAATIHGNDLRVVASGVGERIEQVITVDGERRTYVSTKTPHVDATGHVIGLIGIGTDITERKKAEELMTQANQRLSLAVAEKTAQLAELSQHLIRASEDERERLAAELHDELGALHTVITMDLESMSKEVKVISPDLDDRLRKVLALVQQAREIKRRIIGDLRPVLLDHFGLVPALNHYVEIWSESSKVKVSTDYSSALPALSQELALAMFRIVQESLTNIAKYANARNVRIGLEFLANELPSELPDELSNELILTVEDDGIGIAPEVLERPRSHGIIGMQQRIAHFNGALEVRRRVDGGGTVVSARVPLADDLTPRGNHSADKGRRPGA